jgi:hypothetical protein
MLKNKKKLSRYSERKRNIKAMAFILVLHWTTWQRSMKEAKRKDRKCHKKGWKKSPSVTPELIRMAFPFDAKIVLQHNEILSVIRRLCECYKSKPHNAAPNKSEENRPQLLHYEALFFFCLSFYTFLVLFLLCLQQN